MPLVRAKNKGGMALKKLTLILAMCFIMLSFSGCQLSNLDSDNLMRPPKASGDGQAIQEALDRALGSGYVLRYPRNGIHRSAIVRADFDGDEIDEAVVFYRAATDAGGTRIALMDKTEETDVWTVVYNSKGEGSEVERVVLPDFDGDGSAELIIGWKTYTGSNIIAAYIYSEGQLTSVPVTEPTSTFGVSSSISYSELEAIDIDGDKRDELLIASIDNINGLSSVKMAEYQTVSGAGSLGVSGEITLDSSITGFSGSVSGKVAPDINGMYLGSYRGTAKITTDLIVWDKEMGGLSAPFVSLENQFVRTGDTSPQDIDGDGLIEFSADVEMPSFSVENSEKLYLTTWFGYSPDLETLTEKKQTRIELPDKGYAISFADDWVGKITAQRNNDDEVYFYSYDGEVLGDELFRIKTFSVEEWDELESEQDEESDYKYRSLHTDSYSVFAVLLSARAQSDGITYAEIERCFMPLE